MAKENKVGAFLQITMNIKESDRAAAATVYNKYRQPFLDDIQGAHCKHLLVRDNDVQVLHGFVSVADAENYLKSDLFTQDVVVELKPYFQSEPDVRLYSVVGKILRTPVRSQTFQCVFYGLALFSSVYKTEKICLFDKEKQSTFASHRY